MRTSINLKNLKLVKNWKNWMTIKGFLMTYIIWRLKWNLYSMRLSKSWQSIQMKLSHEFNLSVCSHSKFHECTKKVLMWNKSSSKLSNSLQFLLIINKKSKISQTFTKDISTITKILKQNSRNDVITKFNKSWMHDRF